MKTINRIFRVNMLSSFIFLVLGILLTFRTEGTIHLISSVIGLILLINGGISIIRHFKEEDSSTINLIYGIVAVLAGFVLILNPTTIVSILPFVLGIYFAASGFIKLKYALDIRRYQNNTPIFMIIVAILMIICGVLFIVNPFKGAIAITRIIGIFLMIYSVLDIINYIVIKNDLDIIVKDKWR